MSEWKQHAAKRRDARHTASDIRPPSKAGKRNTKRWCRGVVGREHKPHCVAYNELKGVSYAPEWRVLVCQTCDKQLDYWFPAKFRVGGPPPLWVK